MKKIKFITLISIFLFFLIVIPQSFALENMSIDDNTLTISDDNTPSTNNKDISSDTNNQNTPTNNDNILTENYYFNSNINTEGNGTIDNPYKEFAEHKIKDNSKVHLSNGEYGLTNNFHYTNISFEGESTENTILNGNGYTLDVNNYLTFKNITLKNIKIKSNYIFTFSATNTIFRDCIDENGNGGVLYSKSGSLTLINCTFYNNSAIYGGSIYLNSGTINIYNSTFENNAARYGGAIYTRETSLKCYNSSFKNNNATMLGGGIISIKSKNLEFKDTSFLSNKAGYEGGAIYSFYGYSIITNSTFINNTANAGGALFIDSNTKTTIIDNKFENNTAKYIAGVIYALTNTESIIDNNTYINNLAKANNDLLETNIPYLFIGNGNYTTYIYNSSFTGIIPNSYDLRDYNYVTPVKDQGKGGNCWAFATLGALESCILKASGISYDLSEENMKNLMSMYSDYGWYIKPNDGGYNDMGISYLINWLGPINETDNVYNYNSDISLILNSIFHVQNIIYLTRSNYTDNDAIKKAILDYGAVSTSFCWNWTLIDDFLKDDKNYYNYIGGSANHAVIIVGWDDDYSKNNFKKTPPGDGAWIIKNSWGTDNGDNGFYYVSYYDTGIANPNKLEDTYTFILNDSVKFDKNYQYDIPGKTDYFFNKTSSVWYKNIFNASDNEYLAAVSTIFNKDTNWELSIYVNNILKLNQTGFSKGGYYTINLNEFIQLNIGDIFEVVFKITVNGDAGFPISEEIRFNNYFYKENISFLSYDGENWTDLYNLTWNDYPGHTYNSQVACIKAFTIFNVINTTITLSHLYINDSIIQANITNQYGRPVTAGSVIFTVNGENTTVKVNNGIAMLTLHVNPGEYIISAAFNAVGHISSKNNISISIPLINTNISITSLNEYNPTEIIAEVTNQYGYKINCGNITFTLDNENITANITNGTAKITHIFKNLGLNTITAKYNNIYYYTSSNATTNITIKSTINATNTTQAYNSTYQTTILNNYGNPLKNQNITIIINSTNQIIQTDENGIARINITLNPGTHNITIKNPINNETKTQTITIIPRITENNDLTTIYSSDNEYKVKILDDNGNIAKNVQVTFTINEKTYINTTDNNGYASFKTKDLNATTHIIMTEYKGYTVKNNIYVLKLNTNTQLDVLDITDSYNIQATIIDDYGNPVNTGYVNFTVDDKNYTVNVSNGIAILKIHINPGEYTVLGIFNDNNYNSSNNTTPLIITSINTNISITSLNEYNPTEIIAEVTNQYGYKINCGNITFTLDNENITANITNGTAKITHIFKNLGLNTITAKYNNIYYYTSSNNVTNINIKSTIISNDATKTYNSIYQTTILNNYGNPLKNQNILITINSTEYLLRTDDTGLVKININLNPGIHNITIKNPINNETKTQTITVIKRITENNDLTTNYGVNSEYKVKVLDDDGNIVSGLLVTFTINNQKYTSITDNKGYATLKTINLNPNIYTITAEYKGYTVQNKITIKQIVPPSNPIITPEPVKSTKIILNVKTVKTISKKAKKLVLETKLKINGKIAKNKKVTFIINGKKYTAKTNKNSVAKLTLKKSQLNKILKKVKVGKKIKYQIKYGKKTITKYIKVKK